MEKYKIFACLVILFFHVRESLSRNLKDEETNNSPRIRRHLEEWNSKECVCFPKTKAGPSVSEYFPSYDTQERLIVYLYRNTQTNELTAYIPSWKKQNLFPDLTFDLGDELKSVTSERIVDLFDNAHFTAGDDLIPIFPNTEHAITMKVESEPSFNIGEYNGISTDNVDTIVKSPKELTIPTDANKILDGVKPNFNINTLVYSPSEELTIPHDGYNIYSDLKPNFNIYTLANSPSEELIIPPDGNNIYNGVKPGFDLNTLVESPPGETTIHDGNNIPIGVKPNFYHKSFWQYLPERLTMPPYINMPTNGKQNINLNSLSEFSPGELDVPEGYNIQDSNKPQSSNRFYFADIPSHESMPPDTMYKITSDKPFFNLNALSESSPDELTIPDGDSITVNDERRKYLYINSPVKPLPVEKIILQNQNIITTPKSHAIFNEQNKDVPDIDGIYEHILSAVKVDELTPIPLLNQTNLNFKFDIPNRTSPDTLIANKANMKINAEPGFQRRVKYLPGYIGVFSPPKSDNAIIPSWIEMNDQSRPTDLMNFGFLPSTYTNPTFNSWFSEQMKTIRLNRPSISNAINLNSFRVLLIKALYDNGINISKDGRMYDSKGNLLKMSHLQLRPILLGDPMDYEKLIASGKCVIPYNIPYLEAVLVILVYPPRILAIIPLDFKNALDNQPKGSLLSSRSVTPEDPENEDNLYDQNHDFLNLSENETNEPINEYVSIDSYSVPLQNDYYYKSAATDQTMDQRMEDRPQTTNRRTFINVPTETISVETVSEPKLAPNNQEIYEPNITFLDEKNDIEENKLPEHGDQQDQKPDDEDDTLFIRIVGGNPATSSGTPVSSRGR
ncbi:uncharacterized protein LOC128199376 [Bicyclus anynana]|uniref:Uncharacterized protein LOC128199376 n=1 Tax=Bicyclus anynana TaxID=110368 RepID=A0ABM3LZU2_BICAN|nr:uncharacterized protein LOC128199376 [Bicyclus anynana]